MTRNLAVTPAPAVFRLSIDGVSGDSTVKLFDPLLGTMAAVQVVDRVGSGLVVAAELTDSPRLLVVTEP